MGRLGKAAALAAGGALVGYGTTRWLRAKRDGGEQGDFFADAGTRGTVDIGTTELELPILYHRTDCSFGVFSADLEATREALPSDRLYPVKVARGRAAIAVVSYNYIETGVGPYGEIGVAALCTLDRQAPPVLPAMLEARYPGFGAFVLHLPVTTRIAREAGRAVWGYPKFVADMAFEFRPETHRVELREDGQDVLSLEVERRGRLVQDRKPLVTYSEHHGELIRTELPVRSTYHAGIGRPYGHLELGDHPIGKELRELDISSESIATKSYVDHAAILPAGQAVGDADRPYDGFEGSAAETGRHTVRFAGGPEQVVTEPSAPKAGSESHHTE